MSDPFVGEIRMFGGNFNPTGWATCDGQLLPISQNTALFSLLGTIYGGDGKTTFALPDLRGRSPLQWGTGPGLTLRDIGQAGGQAAVTLVVTSIPAHTHALKADIGAATTGAPAGLMLGVADTPTYVPDAVDLAPMAPETLRPTGNGQPHNNRQPYLGVTMIIALQGIYPPRN
jgi:microcystin-dependent protein